MDQVIESFLLRLSPSNIGIVNSLICIDSNFEKKNRGLMPYYSKHDLTLVRPSIPLASLPLAYSTPLLPFVSFLLTGMLGLANRQTERRQHQAKAKIRRE
jgi:hypothetical protein